jgi:cytochrome c2
MLTPTTPLMMRFVLAAAVTVPAATYAADAPLADAAAKDACIKACKKCHDACRAMRR